ncbi:MAG TPA: hypothetical protein VF858_04250, partial [Gemmatimonadaceae bacterium]
MRHSKKKTEPTPLPEQGAIGSADGFAPDAGGAASQGDGQVADPQFDASTEAGGTGPATSSVEHDDATGAAETGV